MPAGDAAAKRAPLPDEVFLPDELGEGSRAHPCREGLPLGRRLEQAFGAGPAGAGGRRSSAGHGPMVRAAAAALRV